MLQREDDNEWYMGSLRRLTGLYGLYFRMDKLKFFILDGGRIFSPQKSNVNLPPPPYRVLVIIYRHIQRGQGERDLVNENGSQ